MRKFNACFIREKIQSMKDMCFLHDQKDDESITNDVTQLRDLCSTCEFGQLIDSLIKGCEILVIKGRLLRI